MKVYSKDAMLEKAMELTGAKNHNQLAKELEVTRQQVKQFADGNSYTLTHKLIAVLLEELERQKS